MTVKAVRKIVRIDQDRCDGCGLCVPNCAEGAIEIVRGKARLVAEDLCDGLGACLGTCPRGAITIEDRPAEEFREPAVRRRREAPAPKGAPPGAHPAGGCPGSMFRALRAGAKPAALAGPDAPARPSRLTHWPVQLALVPARGPMWQDADVLIAADCVPLALPDFHDRLLAGKSVALSCPKLDDLEPQIGKLTAIFAGNPIRSVTVAHMEVPCCAGIARAVHEALERAGRTDIVLHDVTVGIDGTIQRESS